MNQSQRTLQEYQTSLPPADVIARAKEFFSRRVKIYAAFLEREGPGYVGFRGQGNEEVFIGAVEKDGATLDTVPEGPTRRALVSFLELYGDRAVREAELSTAPVNG